MNGSHSESDYDPSRRDPYDGPYPDPPRRRRSSSGIWAFLLLAVVGMVVVFLIGTLGTVGTFLGSGSGSLDEVFVDGDAGARDRLLLLPVQGMILEGAPDPFGGAAFTSPSAVRRILRAAARNDSIRGVILEVNSPGGGVTASDLIHAEILEFKEESGLPIVAYLKDVAASGGYYAAMAADEVIAHRTTITGSIGVILRLVNYGELFEKVGLRDVTIIPTDTPMKDMGSPTREMTDRERDRFRSIVEDMYERFLDVVDAGRPALDRDTVSGLADGSIYSATQALDNGLVDAIGTRDDAVESLRRRAGLEGDVAIIAYQSPPSLLETLFAARAPGARIEAAVEKEIARLRPSGSGLAYLWPGWTGP